MIGLEELKKLLKELEKATGLHMQITAESPEEIEHAIVQVKQLLGAYKEKYDKNYFLRSLMLGRLHLTEADEYAKKLHIQSEERRVLFLIETKQAVDEFLLELLKNLFPLQSKNYIVKMDHHHVVLLRPSQCMGEEVYEESISIAHMMIDTVNAEAMSSIRVSFGRELTELSDAVGSYSDVSMAMKIRNVFYPDQMIMPYNELGIGGIVYQLPKEACENFLGEVFGGEKINILDEEMKTTITKFFQYNLNIAETSRRLHMHRNTLIYRIEQLQKRTGLDVRNFEDACVFQVAMMVMNYTEMNGQMIKER